MFYLLITSQACSLIHLLSLFGAVNHEISCLDQLLASIQEAQ